jgi:hypothetical protein
VSVLCVGPTFSDTHASESYYLSYIVATSGVHRLASQICHNQLFRKKLPQNILPMNSTEVSSLAAHNTLCSSGLTVDRDSVRGAGMKKAERARRLLA